MVHFEHRARGAQTKQTGCETEGLQSLIASLSPSRYGHTFQFPMPQHHRNSAESPDRVFRRLTKSQTSVRVTPSQSWTSPVRVRGRSALQSSFANLQNRRQRGRDSISLNDLILVLRSVVGAKIACPAKIDTPKVQFVQRHHEMIPGKLDRNTHRSTFLLITTFLPQLRHQW